MAAESEQVKKELEKLCFPQVEGDTAPSALIPKACSSLQKYITKMDGLLSQFAAAETLSPLQTKSLVFIDPIKIYGSLLYICSCLPMMYPVFL